MGQAPALYFWLEPAFYLALLLGLCLGSFATALSWRLPRGGSVIAQERSTCNSCGRVLGFFDLIPVLSWLLLRGRCRQCGAKIGWRYPLIELSTLALCLAFYFTFGGMTAVLALYFLAAVIVSIIDIDLHYKIIPNLLNGAILLIGMAMMAVLAWQSGNRGDFLSDALPPALWGVLLYGGGSLAMRGIAMHVMKREPMGLGDIKFFAAIGFWMGNDVDVLAWYMILAGGIGTALAIFWQRIKKEREFPFGPALVVAFAVMLLWMKPGLMQFMLEYM